MFGDGYGFGYMLSIVPLFAGLVLFLSYRGYRVGKERKLSLLGVLLIVFSIFLIVDEYRLIEQKEDQFNVAYLAYRAYDDGVLSDSEYGVLREIGLTDALYRELNSDDVSKSVLREYENLVNNSIKEFDESNGHLVFKEKVVKVEKDILWGVSDDGVIDDREKSLILFARDMLGEPSLSVSREDSFGISDFNRIKGKMYSRYSWFREAEEVVDESVRLKEIEERGRVLKLVD